MEDRRKGDEKRQETKGIMDYPAFSAALDGDGALCSRGTYAADTETDAAIKTSQGESGDEGTSLKG